MNRHMLRHIGRVRNFSPIACAARLPLCHVAPPFTRLASVIGFWGPDVVVASPAGVPHSADMIKRIRGMPNNEAVSHRCKPHGIECMGVAWEDSGRTAGSVSCAREQKPCSPRQ